VVFKVLIIRKRWQELHFFQAVMSSWTAKKYIFSARGRFVPIWKTSHQ